METMNDYPFFELQSIHVSYEERRWLHRQRYTHKTDDIVDELVELHKKIPNYQYLSTFTESLSTSTMLPSVSLKSTHSLYYPNISNRYTNNEIDQFRLYNQQFFQLIFHDLCQFINYRIFVILMEGMIFYTSQTVKEYTNLITIEMQKFLRSFPTYIQSRSKKIEAVLSYFAQHSLSSYTIVHTYNQNNIGILFQLLPKIFYPDDSLLQSKPLVIMGEYANHTISFEELRYFDYFLNMKNKRHTGEFTQLKTKTQSSNVFSFSAVGTLPTVPTQFHVLHSSPIIYPYDENMVHHGKYPSFWTDHTDENSDVLFKNIPIDSKTPEFLFVRHSFHKTVPQADYRIVCIERIENPHLWEKFSSHRSYMRRKNGASNLHENWLFHGTNSKNHHNIMSHGFNRSFCQDNVIYGRGVYFSRFACYSSHYGDRKDLSFLFLCRVLVGYSKVGSRDVRYPPNINLPNGKEIQVDSTTDERIPFTIVCTFHDDQNYPEYIITYMSEPSEN